MSPDTVRSMAAGQRRAPDSKSPVAGRSDSTARRRGSSRGRSGLLLLVLTSVLVAALAMTTGAAGATADGNATLELVENTTTDETVTVDLRTSATNVTGYQANVTYDPDVLAVRSVEGVTLNDPETNDDRSGMVTFTQSQTRGVDEPTLATITFDVVGEGTTDLEFVESLDNEPETVVSDGDGDHIDVTLEGLTVDTAADESGGIGGIGGGSGDGEDTAESDTDNAETVDDDADETADNNTEADETVDEEQPNPSEEGDSPDEASDDEQSSNSDDSETFSDATPLVSNGILALALSIFLVMTGSRMLRWRQ